MHFPNVRKKILVNSNAAESSQQFRWSIPLTLNFYVETASLYLPECCNWKPITQYMYDGCYISQFPPLSSLNMVTICRRRYYVIEFYCEYFFC